MGITNLTRTREAVSKVITKKVSRVILWEIFKLISKEILKKIRIGFVEWSF